jgi:hypothetical protein
MKRRDTIGEFDFGCSCYIMWKLLIVYGRFMLSSHERQKELVERTDVVSR